MTLGSKAPVSAVVAALLAALCACGDGTVVESGAAPRAASSSAPLFERMRTAARSTPHVGVRRYEVHVYRDGADLSLAYTEAVADRGDGCYSIEPLDVDSNLVDSFLFLGMQAERQAYLRRYRDFQIHDLDLFLENYSIRDDGVSVSVAGRDCSQLVAESRLDGRRYTLAVDLETALVLRYRETLPDGTLLSSMSYEQFGPVESDVDCFGNEITEQELLLRGDPSAQVGFETWRPSLLPDGYRALSASKVRGPRGFDWFKLTYSDGIETLFFLQREPDRAAPQRAAGQPVGAHDDRVLAYEEGALGVVQGTLGSREVVAVGKVGADELLMLLESARE